MSASTSLRAVREGKEHGVRVTCEVAPHHFMLTDESLATPVSYDTNMKMNPPLRATADRDEMLKGIVDGAIDAIATDHAPHHYDEKKVEFDLAPFGIVGLETCVSHLLRSSGASWPHQTVAACRAAVGESLAHRQRAGRHVV